jgi:hypothetical protein
METGRIFSGMGYNSSSSKLYDELEWEPVMK